ncbi:MAG: O-antigen ligase family protein [Candidatus Eisenbacteria bacterium]
MGARRLLENLLFFFLLMFFLAAPASVAYSEIALGVAALLFAARRLVRRPEPLFPRPVPSWRTLALPAAGWVVAYGIAALFAREKGASAAKLLKLTPMILLFLLPALLWNEKRLRHAAAALLLGGAITSAYGIAYWLDDPSTRLGGFIGFYMSTAGILMMISLVGFALLFTRGLGGALRWIAVAVLPVILFALYLTDTRGAWLGLVAGLVVLVVSVDRRLVAVPALLIGLLLLAPGDARRTALSAFDPGHPRNRERTFMWKAGWRIFLDHKWTGVGPAGMGEVYLEYMDRDAKEKAKHLHSVPVHVLASLGLFGFAAWAWLFAALPVWIVRRTGPVRRRGSPASRGLLAAGLAVWAGFVVNGLGEWNLGDVEVITLFWSVLGLAAASAAASNERGRAD